MNTNPKAIMTAHVGAALALAASLLQAGCKPQNTSEPAGRGSSSSGKMTIQVKGSDTMVNLAQVWAEEYNKVDPNVSIEVSGGGTGVGFAALFKGTVDIANASRNAKPDEIKQAKKNTGKEPVEFVMGYDAIAIYVHKDNPLDQITEEQLAEIYAEGGKTTKWSQFRVKVPGRASDEIIRVSRQSSSGTYELFRERVLKNRDFKLGSRDMNGSKEVVDLVGSTPGAIGYSGMGYATPSVKMLKVAAGQHAYAPTAENTLNKTYPLARSLLTYTLGEPRGAIKRYIDWQRSEAGQKIVEKTGFVPLASAKVEP
jgi:phosphate transport system substrate-binding protein